MISRAEARQAVELPPGIFADDWPGEITSRLGRMQGDEVVWGVFFGELQVGENAALSCSLIWMKSDAIEDDGLIDALTDRFDEPANGGAMVGFSFADWHLDIDGRKEWLILQADQRGTALHSIIRKDA